MTDRALTTSPKTNVTACMQWASSCQYERRLALEGGEMEHCALMEQHGCITQSARVQGVAAPLHYREQLVVFDSLAYFIQNPLTYYPETTNFDPIAFAYEASCEYLDTKFSEWGIFPNITARKIGCRVDDSLPERTKRESHIYICIQDPKKMHPSFDPILAGIIRRDPNAKILVDHRMPSLIPRWLISLNITEKEIMERFIFVPRLKHQEYLQLVALSSVFLNTFPFGAGVTSSEAIALGVPVVVYAETSSVINLAMAQVRALGDPWPRELIVQTVEAYVNRVIEITRLDSMSSDAGAWNSNGLRRFREALYRSSVRLHGPEPLAAAAAEWGYFLKRVV